MPTNSGSGFGKPQSQPKTSSRSTQRARASQQYDRMKSDGLPEYEVYIRTQGKKTWYPVGVIAVKRSSQIHQAIFANKEDLLQGAFRLYPVLRKNQQQLEYGYRLKEDKDDPIQLAVQPQTMGLGGVQAAIAQVGDRLSSLFKRK